MRYIVLTMLFACAAFSLHAGPRIIPLPKEAAFKGGALPLSNAIMVIQAGSRQAEIAAEEINGRLAELKAPALKMMLDTAPESDFASCPVVIHIGEADKHKHLKALKDKLDVPANPMPLT